MENRSFDHLLGFLHKTHNPEIAGLNGKEFNHVKVDDPKSKIIHVNMHGYNTGPDDPGHSFEDTAEEIFGHKLAHGAEMPHPKMDGFVQANVNAHKSDYNPMSMFNETTAPIINTLAKEFAIFDHWFCALPGPTDPNRAFAMSGTSDGVISNFNGTLWSQQSYFNFLTDHNVPWKAYYQDDPWAVMYFQDSHIPKNKKNIFLFEKFFTDVKSGDVASFTWLQPRMTSHMGPPTWQHPDASVSEGERLIDSVYKALRTSSVWESTAFLITYDEHGGFYDHMAPPQKDIPSPDGIVASNGFKFDRLGIRVPAVLVSPLVPKGSVFHFPASGGPYFDSTSIIATSNKIFGITEHMTKRDAWVGTWENIFTEPKPRTDCPTSLPYIPRYTLEELLRQQALPLNDHMQIQVDFYCKFNKHGPDCGKDIKNQYQASVFIAAEAKKMMEQ